MELELKHLAPYLPYKLMVKVFDDKIKVMNATNSSSVNWVGIGACVKWSKNCKPILRPLSDLPKFANDDKSINEHTINLLMEEKYGVDYGIFSCYKNKLSIELDGDPSAGYDRNKSISFEMIEDIRNELLKGHYDIFGLIEAELAIDINTIPEMANS